MRPFFKLCAYAVILAGCIILLINGVAAGYTRSQSSVGSPIDLDAALYRAQQTSPVPIQTNEERARLRALGERIAHTGSAGGAAPCARCHGLKGAGDTSGAFPRIAGLTVYYATKQLGDYAASARPNAVMTPIAQKLSPEEMEAVSAYYAEQAAVLVHYNDFDPNELLWGQAIATRGSDELGLEPCESCHKAGARNYSYSAPVLAGQYASYTALQLHLWRRGVRANDVGDVMSDIAAKLPEDAAHAVAKYYEAMAAGLATHRAAASASETGQ